MILRRQLQHCYWLRMLQERKNDLCGNCKRVKKSYKTVLRNFFIFLQQSRSENNTTTTPTANIKGKLSSLANLLITKYHRLCIFCIHLVCFKVKHIVSDSQALSLLAIPSHTVSKGKKFKNSLWFCTYKNDTHWILELKVSLFLLECGPLRLGCTLLPLNVALSSISGSAN